MGIEVKFVNDSNDTIEHGVDMKSSDGFFYVLDDSGIRIAAFPAETIKSARVVSGEGKAE